MSEGMAISRPKSVARRISEICPIVQAGTRSMSKEEKDFLSTQANGKQIVSERWITECTTWGPADGQVRYGVASPNALLGGYKAFMWHARPDGSQVVFNGHHGQRVFIDMETQTVLAQTAVDHAGAWQRELYAMFAAAVKLPG